MSTEALIIGLAGVLAAAAPIVFATLGETLTERSGVINLSVNGTILLSAMASFGVAVVTGSLLLGFLTGMLVGAGVALVVAGFSISLTQSQVAVGFVLTWVFRGPACLPWPFRSWRTSRSWAHCSFVRTC
jgi:simple sugar transport system permease protein